MTSQREWTILLYMAGDNGKTFESKYGKYSLMAEMTGAGITDIAEVETVGTTDQVAILAQFDTLPSKDPLAKELGTEAGGTYRLEIHKGRTALENIVEVMADVNTGDPAELARFIVWGMDRCPAKRTMLVLWNHGLGWKDDDIYAKVRGMSRSAAQGRNARGSNAAMFRSTAQSINRRASRTRSSDARAILCDDTSMDFLTNVEMSQALRVAEFAADEADAVAVFSDKPRLDQMMSWGNEGARRHLSIIGMDACLMAMIEVQYQVRKFADVMVASQEVEPMHGWPYDKILAELAARPTLSPHELSTLIVDRFVESYVSDSRRRPDVTQSAIDLSRLGEAADLIQSFARSLGKEFSDDLFLEKAYKDARDKAPRDGYAFEDPEYVDLVSLLDAMIKGYRGDHSASRTVEAATALQDWLLSGNSPVIRNAVSGKFDGKAHGVSIYTPRDLPSPLYKELDFHGAGWYNAVKKIYEA
ncbi:MAG TPA: clostripain-related cysteine peptidase [Anaerolineae bacterium]|nr:clostripain-related cysteine peptidase [Anaerolineae bacterium]